jgi:hypothetical protein
LGEQAAKALGADTPARAAKVRARVNRTARDFFIETPFKESPPVDSGGYL